jgi:hypothetical protein
MLKIILFVVPILFQTSIFAQKTKTSYSPDVKVAMTADQWEFDPQKTEFTTYKSVTAMHLLTSMDPATLKNFNFTNGTIEFDIAPKDSIMTGIFFRRQNPAESEYFYLRVRGEYNPGALWTIQYAPFIKTVNMWDMLPYYQAPAALKINEWNHLKLVVSGAQMRVYVNDPNRPVLEVPQLEGNTTEGSLAFTGKSYFANLVIKPNQTEGLLPTAGPDPTEHDPRYLRQWQVTEPVLLPEGNELSYTKLPDSATTWQPITAERRGLVNLTRRFGIEKNKRRVVWLKVKLKAATAQNRRVNFGFSDEVWVFINRQALYVDKNLYMQAIMKEPEGRCTIDNTSFNLPLKQGVNELLIGVANDFFGWGIIARLDNMEEVEVVQ